jgi:hypothetical protein
LALYGQTGVIASGRIGFSVLLIDGLIFIEHSVLPAEPKIQDTSAALGIVKKTDNVPEPHALTFL